MRLRELSPRRLGGVKTYPHVSYRHDMTAFGSRNLTVLLCAFELAYLCAIYWVDLIC